MKPGFLFVTASFMVLISVEPQAAHANGDPRVGKLISQSGAALHVDALHSMKVIHAKGSVVATGLSGSGDYWNEMGGLREAALFSTPPLGGGNGWDGDENWNLDQTGLVIVDGSVLGRSSAINQAYVRNYDLWTPSYGGATITWGGSKSQDGKIYDVLTVTPPNSSVPIDVRFDKATHLPVTVVQTAGPLVTTITMADFHPVQGLMIPYRVDTSNMNGTTSFTVTSVEVDPPDGASHLTTPTSSHRMISSIANRATQAAVPIQISKNQVWLDVMLNGKGPFHFKLSTPAERTSSIRQSPKSLAWPAVDRQRSQARAVQVLPPVSAGDQEASSRGCTGHESGLHRASARQGASACPPECRSMG